MLILQAFLPDIQFAPGFCVGLSVFKDNSNAGNVEGCVQGMSIEMDIPGCPVFRGMPAKTSYRTCQAF
ncbi:hypothetical protein [Azotobacter salinestris]|uniref:hypothetical protein n=1 Tax=Azotobacter salinestris TaxID=69964 RepID=UPI0012668E44|nr:hypothetical protein [Azotobacter salinestris]